MMQYLIYVIAFLWIGRIFINIFSYIHLWFVKEYRPDRMMIHLKNTRQGRWIYFPQMKLPPMTPKTIVLFLFLLATEIFLFFVLPFPLLIKIFLLDLLLFPISFFYVFVLRLPTQAYHLYQIQKAKKMLRLHKWNSVIGITGSFGKTSTKEFLSTILSSRYRVLKTEASKNSAIGISEVVLHNLTKNDQMFVVEMGAYGPGEIQEMTTLVQPNIGIITAINAQHQDLFGTIENTMRAKYELLAGLAGNRIAIVNADNTYAHEMGNRASKEGCNVWFVTVDKKTHPEAMFWIDAIKTTPDYLIFTIHNKKESHEITAHIRGEHFVINCGLAIAAAVAAGMSFRDAVTGANTIRPFERVMQPFIGKNGETVINDTFNNNPDAAIAALKYLTIYKGKKILVFQPMIELGKYTSESHERVGEKAAEICDEIILTNTNFSDAFIRGVHKYHPEKIVHIFSALQAATFIRQKVREGDAVLCKGKEAEHVWKLLVHS